MERNWGKHPLVELFPQESRVEGHTTGGDLAYPLPHDVIPSPVSKGRPLGREKDQGEKKE